MNKPAHLMGGLTAGIAASKYIAPSIPQNGTVEEIVSIGAMVCGALFGSLLPDIDHRNSYIGRRLRMTSYIISKTFGHRGIVHTPIVIIALTLLLLALVTPLTGITHVISRSFVIGLSSGMFSHLFLDMMNRRGIPLLYPITSKNFRLAKFKSGGTGDTLANIACILLIIWMLQDVVVDFIHYLL